MKPATLEALMRAPSGGPRLAARAAGGLLWSSGAQVGRHLVQFGVTALLVRLLAPENFGLVAMVLVVTGFAGMFTELGFGAALVQRRDLADRHLSTAFWVTTGLGAGVAALVIALAPLVATFYAEPALRAMTRVLALQLVAASLGVVPRALLVRRLEFRAIALAELLAAVLGGVLALGLALGGAGVWSLVAQALAGGAIATAGYFRLTGWRPTHPISPAAARELVRYSAGVLGYNAVNYWARNADNLLIGRVLGSAQLGIYTLAYQLMYLPLQNIPHVCGQVMFPVLSELQDRAAEARQFYTQAVRFIALVAFPVMLFLCVAAPEIVAVLFGERWVRAGVLLRVLAIAGLSQSIVVTAGSVWQALGRTDILFRWGVVASAAAVLAITVGLRWQVEGVAVAYTICVLLLTLPALRIAGAMVGLTLADYARLLTPTLLAASFMAAAAAAARHALLLAGTPPAVALAGTLATALLVYSGSLWAVGFDSVIELRRIVGALWTARGEAH